MTIVRVGTNKQYSEGWEAAFAGKKPAKKKAAAPAKASAKKKVAKKKSKG